MTEHAGEQRNAVPQREEADIDDDVLQPVEEENDSQQKQQMIVPRDHVLGADIEERTDRKALVRNEEVLRGAIHAVRLGAKRKDTAQAGKGQKKDSAQKITALQNQPPR